MSTLAYRIYCELERHATTDAIAAAIDAPRDSVTDSLDRLSRQGHAVKVKKAHGPGYPAIWKQGKEMPDHMLNSKSQLANLRKGPYARAAKYRGVRRPEVGLKISQAMRMRMSRAHFATLVLPEPKCLLALCWRKSVE